jgi:hypothetical protein
LGRGALKAQKAECEDFVTIVKLMRIIIKFCGFLKLNAARPAVLGPPEKIAALGLELLGRIPI